MGIELDTYIITFEIYGKYEVKAENIFQALELIKNKIVIKNIKMKVFEEISFKNLQIISAIVVNYRTDNCIDITDFL